MLRARRRHQWGILYEQGLVLVPMDTKYERFVFFDITLVPEKQALVPTLGHEMLSE